MYVTQHFSSSSIQISTKIELWDVGLVTFLYFQQYLSHRSDGSHFLKTSTWSTTLFRALRHSSTRMLEIIHKSWNSAMFWCAIRPTGLPGGHQCLHIQSCMCTTYKYNQMQGDGFTVPQAYETGPGLSTYTSQHITGWFLLVWAKLWALGYILLLAELKWSQSTCGISTDWCKFPKIIPTQELQVLKDMIKNTLCSTNNLK